MKQNEQKNDEKTELQWQAPILDEIDVALLTQLTFNGGAQDGATVFSTS